jgi:hypothetical protein
MAGPTVQYQTRVMAPLEARVFVFAFDNVPEILSGATITSATVTGPGGTPLAGVTAGTPAVTTMAEIVDAQGNTVAAGRGVCVAIYAPSSAGQDYIVECRAALSNGATVVVSGKVAVRVAI